MYKIIIADDNPLILMGLKNMIHWDTFHATLAGEAKNGEQAFRLIKELKPDLLITDIRMPGKDGLYLLEQIRNNYPEINTIVISAYDEFQYAKEAMKAGSIDYILKPIDPKELNAAINKAFNRKHSEKWELADLVSKSSDSILYALKAKRKYDISELSKMLAEYEDIEIYKLEDVFLILYSGKGMNCRSIEKHLSALLTDNFLLGNQKINAGEIADLWEKALYDAACQMLKSPHRDYTLIKSDSLNEEKITLYCTTGNDQKVKEMFYGHIAGILSRNNKDIGAFTAGVNAFLQLLLSIDKKTFSEVRNLMDKVADQENTLVYFTVDEVVMDVELVIESICNEYSRMIGNKQDLVNRVKEMVKKNYQNELSLNETAQLFFVSPSYLSRIFKQETGTNLNNYITMIRMEKAKQLLAETQGKVIDIARMVGYPESNYFTKVFKKYTGYSPSDKR